MSTAESLTPACLSSHLPGYHHPAHLREAEPFLSRSSPNAAAAVELGGAPPGSKERAAEMWEWMLSDCEQRMPEPLQVWLPA